jgi:bifunctional enzyme CysN/CysC
VQLVIRPDRTLRGYAGTVASGVLRTGSEVTVLPSGRRSHVAGISAGGAEVQEAFPPMSVCVTLTDEVDVSRGDVLVHPQNLPTLATDLEAVLVWMADTPMATGRPYVIKHGTATARAEVSQVRYKFDVNNLSRSPAEALALNEIGRVHLKLSRALAFDAYARNRATGCFILVDPVANGTVGAGMILDRRIADDAIDEQPGTGARSPHLRRRRSQVGADERAARLGHAPATIWLTGLPASGKSTLAYALERRLFESGTVATVLDGENLRLGISDDLGFAALDRSENVRRAAHVARVLNEAGLVAIVALVSPYEADRAEARAIIGPDRFLEVHVAAPLSVCESRDPDLYSRARGGEIPRFTGISAPYEPPREPGLELATGELSVAEAVDRLLAAVAEVTKK